MTERESALHRTVRRYGINGTCAGYRYLVYALELIREEPRRLELVTKLIYPDTARHFGVTAGCVEGAMRTALRRACRREPLLAGEGLTVKGFLRVLAEDASILT